MGRNHKWAAGFGLSCFLLLIFSPEKKQQMFNSFIFADYERKSYLYIHTAVQHEYEESVYYVPWQPPYFH